MVIAAGCGSTPTTSEKPSGTAAAYKDGTYEGTSDAGKHPGLKVSVVVKDGKIASVDVLEHQETEGISTPAIESLPKLIVESQSAEVDSVAGASLTSGAIKEAVANALAQAK